MQLMRQFLCLAMAACVFPGLNANAAPADAKSRPPAVAPALVAATAAAPSVVRVLVLPSREAKLSSQMSGRIIDIPLAEGAAFSRGDLLVAFDCEHQRARLDMALAAETRARAQKDSKDELLKHAAATDLDVVFANADLEEMKAKTREAQAAVRDCRIVAPYAGRLNRKHVNEYESVGLGAPLVEIQERGVLRLEALVPSSSLVWLATGQVFDVRIDELGRDFQMAVESIGSRIDPASQTVGIKGVFKGNANGVLPGMSGKITLRKPASK